MPKLAYLRFASLTAAFLIVMARPAASHPTGVSKVDITFRADSVEASVDVNRDDLWYALGFNPVSETPRSEYGSMSDRIAYYYQTRLDLKFDGASAPMQVLKWKKTGGDPAAKLDSAGLSDPNIILHLGWRIPAGARHLELGSKLFAELEVQPLCHLRIFAGDVEIKHKFLSLDDRFSLPIEPDSLAAMAAVARQPASAPGKAIQTAVEEESVVGRFLWLGFTHILPEGTDHILFVLGLFFFSTLLRPLLLQVTAFTIAHSITLALSLLGVFSLPAAVVEPLIALSIMVVAVENIFFRKMRPSRFLVVFAFGLVHGLGFAGVLKGLGLPEGQFFKVLISFNLGVELGQLAVIAIASALTVWMWRRPWYFRRVVVPVSVLIAGVGLFWFIQRLMFYTG
ncbi:MAG: HupE/UreJ family protein [Fibrobacteria bacterium]